MFEQFIWYLKGYVRIRVSGYSPERFLNACRYKNIYIWDLKRVCGAYEMNLSVSGFHRLKEIIRKTGTKVCIIRRSGLPFLFHRYRKRHILFSGFILCICLILFMTRYIWGIDIRGNLSYTDDTLKKFLASEQIKNGMKKTNVDCQKIVRDLRRTYDGIIWVSASIDGCRLVIQIKENEDGLADNSTISRINDQSTDIIADTDCTITSITTRTGIAQVKKGVQEKKVIFWYQDRSPSAMMQKKSQGTHPVDRMLTYPAKPVFRIKRCSQKTISKKNITNQDIILSRKKNMQSGQEDI